MPEGDTVWLAARRLHDALAGRPLVRTDFRVPQLAAADLQGADVLNVASRGKHLLMRLATPRLLTLHSHLRMDGSWHIYRPGAKRHGGPAWQIRAELANAEWVAVAYRMPVLELLDTADEPAVVGHLGPDVLGEDWDADKVLRRLSAEPERAIGDALLDQRNLAGVGNLYKVETLFLAGVDPWRRTADVADLRTIVDLAKRLLERNKAAPEQSTTGDLRRGRQHWVYGRKGRPCRRCGTAISFAMQGQQPQDRVTYWCPRCQQ